MLNTLVPCVQDSVHAFVLHVAKMLSEHIVINFKELGCQLYGLVI